MFKIFVFSVKAPTCHWPCVLGKGEVSGSILVNACKNHRLQKANRLANLLRLKKEVFVDPAFELTSDSLANLEPSRPPTTCLRPAANGRPLFTGSACRGSAKSTARSRRGNASSLVPRYMASSLTSAMGCFVLAMRSSLRATPSAIRLKMRAAPG
jgi:hypothetical protein